MLFKIPTGFRDILSETLTSPLITIPYPTPEVRAHTLRSITAVQNESAINSLEIPDHPLFAFGYYAKLSIVDNPDAQEIIITQSPDFVLTPMICLLAGALDQLESYTVPPDKNLQSFRSGLSGAKRTLLKCVDNPLHVEAIYYTTTFIKDRTVGFINMADRRKFSTKTSTQPIDESP